MEISEVRIKLVANSSERLRAFCSVTLQGSFVVRDLKIIDGVNGVFVAMPSRKLTDRCGRCGCKNHLRAKYCSECGTHLRENRAPKDSQGRAKLHADIAHPINAACREQIQKAVVEAYEQEIERSKSPDYQPPDFEDFDEFDSEPGEMAKADVQPSDEAVRPGSSDSSRQDQFSDYKSLIADLKRDAADRRPPSGVSSMRMDSPRLPPSEGENALGKPAYVKRPISRPAESASGDKPTVAGKPAPAPKQGEEDSFGQGL